MTAADLIIEFLLEDEDSNAPNWGIRVGYRVYYGVRPGEAIIAAFDEGAFAPEYTPDNNQNEFFRKTDEILRKYGAEIVLRPYPKKQWHMRDDFTQPFPWDDPDPKFWQQPEPVTSDDVLDVYQRAKQYPEGSPEREKLMQQAREMSARLESLLSSFDSRDDFREIPF